MKKEEIERYLALAKVVSTGSVESGPYQLIAVGVWAIVLKLEEIRESLE